MEINKTKELAFGGMFIIIGVLLPMIFHSFGVSGSIVLPMHIPVLISGFILSPVIALIVGGITPILSFLLTGMPPLFPSCLLMCFELSTYALVVSVLKEGTKLNIYCILTISMILGRVVFGLVFFVFSIIFNLNINVIESIIGGIITGIPGILIQIIFIPPVVIFIKKVFFKKEF